MGKEAELSTCNRHDVYFAHTVDSMRKTALKCDRIKENNYVLNVCVCGTSKEKINNKKKKTQKMYIDIHTFHYNWNSSDRKEYKHIFLAKGNWKCHDVCC